MAHQRVACAGFEALDDEVVEPTAHQRNAQSGAVEIAGVGGHECSMGDVGDEGDGDEGDSADELSGSV